jgi:hypothetical protein
VHDIVNFVTTEEYLAELLDFDPDMFFRIIVKLFRGAPWKFVSKMTDYDKEINVEATDILAVFETRGHKSFQHNGDRKILDSFYLFVL